MKARIAAAAVISFCCATAHAGSGPGRLSCEAKESESMVTLKGLIPATEETLDITLSDGAASIRMTDEDADAYRIEALEEKVFSIIIKRKIIGGEVTLYAIPKTVKAKKRLHGAHATFDAIMRAPNPRREGPVRSAADMLPRLKMSCTYEYSI